MTQYLQTPQGRTIAYDHLPGRAPEVVFLGGYGSDMTGTKALHLRAWAKASGRAFLRFDYSGHGQSSGRLAQGCIGDWLQDAQAVIGAICEGPQILVGSSMGGWIALLIARAHPAQIAGLALIAAAPDFTEDALWQPLGPAQRAELLAHGQIILGGGDQGRAMTVTRRLIEDGRSHLVLRSPLVLPFALRLLHGSADAQVPQALALALMDHVQCADLQLTLVKDADHRFASPWCLALIETTLEALLARSAIG